MELFPLSLFKKTIKNDSLMFLPIVKNIRSKLRAFAKYISMLATFSPTSVLSLHYGDYRCYSIELSILF